MKLNNIIPASLPNDQHRCPHEVEYTLFSDNPTHLYFTLLSYRINCPVAPGIVFSSSNYADDPVESYFDIAELAVGLYEQVVSFAIEQDAIMIYKGKRLRG
jgi:hypothetical protein